MAAPIMKPFCKRVLRLSYQCLKYSTINLNGQSTLSFQRKRVLKKTIFKTTVGIGSGVSLGLFGFGSKVEKTDIKEIANEEKTKSKDSKESISESDNTTSIAEPREDEGELQRIYNEAKKAQAQGNLAKADSLYKEGMEIADAFLYVKQITKDKHLVVSSMYSEGQVEVAMAQNRFEDARALVETTLDKLTHRGMAKDDDTCVQLILKLADICEKQQKYKEAEEVYKITVSLLFSKVDAFDKIEEDQENVQQLPLEKQITVMLLGKALGNYGRFLANQERFQEASGSFETFRKICGETIGKASDPYVKVLNDLGTLNIILGNFDLSEDYFREGITLSEKAKLPELPMLHCNMGALQIQKGDYVSAEKSCRMCGSLSKQFGHLIAARSARLCGKRLRELRK